MNDRNTSDLRRSMIEGTDFSEEDLISETDKLKILSFRMDSRGENIVSSIDGKIVFIDRWYSGESIRIGDVWLCSVKATGNVYHAMPMKKLTIDVLLGINKDLRDGIIETLWKTNRKDYERIFEEKYKTEVNLQTMEKADREMKQLYNEMQVRIDTLMKQLEQTDYLLSSSLDEKELLPENVEPEESDSATSGKNKSSDKTHQAGSFKVERVSKDEIYSKSFTDGYYKVLISPNKKVVLLYPSLEGMAICSKNRIVLNSLDEIAPFTKRQELIAKRMENGEVHIFL